MFYNFVFIFCICYCLVCSCFMFVFLIMAVVTYAVWYEKKRTAAWKAEAEALGFTFTKGDSATRNKLILFPVFSQGTKRKLNFVIRGESKGTKLVLGDYTYTIERVKTSGNDSVYTQTICAILNKDLNLPHFYLRKEGLFNNLFNEKDIDFDEDPEFSKAFTLESKIPKLARKLFSPQVRDFFIEHKKTPWQIEGIGPAIVVHSGKSIKPAKTRELMEMTFSILELMQQYGNIDLEQTAAEPLFAKTKEDDFWGV